MNTRRSLLGPLLLAAWMTSALAPADTGARNLSGPPMRALEEALETSGAALSLPDGAVGRVEARGCRTCPTRAFVLGSGARFFIGAREIGYAELRAALNGRPNGSVAVFYRPRSTEITRIMVMP